MISIQKFGAWRQVHPISLRDIRNSSHLYVATATTPIMAKSAIAAASAGVPKMSTAGPVRDWNDVRVMNFFRGRVPLRIPISTAAKTRAPRRREPALPAIH